ncbi:cell wall metabolism sensor histidine kinase WalK [Paenibacillus sp. OV219]|uniref:sensor histidine kinase n=1 Tax=Paenibacillus sp. OV219 TaxID=1884377 RepID=UPI0008D20ABE|nr:HAMP domain-containing sensor histidine kinase [Paenibacillus sp. OV219]SEO20647.1 Signal transduction histidine kinase [Paenibacillus sp. OV219]
MSIRLRLTLWYSVILAVTLIAFGVAIYFFVGYNTYKEMKAKIETQVNAINITSTLDMFDNFKVSPSSIFADDEIYIQVINYKKGVVQTTQNLRRLDMLLPYPEQKKVTESDEGFQELHVDKYPFLTYQHLLKQNGEVFGMLQVAAYSGREDKFLNELRTTLIFSLIVVVLIAFTLGLFLARQALRPIENVIRASNQIDNGSDLSMRIPHSGPKDELGRLTDTLNGMLGRIETTYNELDDAYKAQRRFVSDASHELRTPLTTIRGNIELLERMWLPALEAGTEQQEQEGSSLPQLSDKERQRVMLTREAMGDIAGEAKRMSSLVNDLLALARADAGYEMEKSVQPLLPLVEDVARKAQLLPRNVEWRIGNLSAIANVEVDAHADFLRQLFFIFVENAFKYTPSGYVELRAVRSGNQAGIIIKDTGIGMASKEVPHIFERFYRADESRGQTSGTGLGLSIAKWIIDEHGGSVEVSTREGEGTTFIVWLPVAFHEKINEV